MHCELIVPGLFAVGEAACASVHGANRLGSNSLIDLVVFGRAAAYRCAETIKRDSAMPELPKGAGEEAVARLDRFRYANGGTPTAALRLKMQKTMQTDCAVFRTADVLEQGVRKIHDVWKESDDIKVSDRSLIWNTDLIETLEFDNLISQAAVTVAGALAYALAVKNCFAMNVEFYTGVDERLEVPVVLPPTLDLMDIRGLKVLVADDVADTGKTLELVRDVISEHVAETRCAVLYQKPRSVIDAEYVWKATDRWINFPWSDQAPVVAAEVLDA